MDKLTQLKAMYREYQRMKFHRVPDFAFSFPNAFNQASTTNGLTNLIITAIRLKGWQAERISSGGRYVDDSKVITDVIGFTKKIGKGKYIPGQTTDGTADISATIDGKSVKIEVKNKRTKDKQSPKQKEYQKKLELTGGVYFIAKDIEQALEFVFSFPDNPRKLEYWLEIGV